MTFNFGKVKVEKTLNQQKDLNQEMVRIFCPSHLHALSSFI